MVFPRFSVGMVNLRMHPALLDVVRDSSSDPPYFRRMGGYAPLAPYEGCNSCRTCGRSSMLS
jgi:hypothetical protein